MTQDPNADPRRDAEPAADDAPQADQDTAGAEAAGPEEAVAEEAATEAEAAEAAAAEPDPAAEIAALNDKLLRALAEGENLRRRAQKEREDTRKFAIAGFARDLLSVADNLRRAIDSLPDGARDDDEGLNAFVEGVEMTERELAATLERHGIARIEPLGEKFNHDLHEAMFEVPTADAEPGTVVQVMEAGYVLNDRLLRAARVGVAKAPPDEPEPPQHVDTTV